MAQDKGIERLEQDARDRGYEDGMRSMLNQIIYAKDKHSSDHDCQLCDLVRWIGGGPRPAWITATEMPLPAAEADCDDKS